MGSNPSKTNDGNVSDRQIAVFGIGMLVLLLAMAFYGVALIILASIVTLGSIAVGVSLILRSYEPRDTNFQAISAEIEKMSNDASFDIAEELIVWDKLKYSAGIGTNFAVQHLAIEDIHRRLINAREELNHAKTPIHRIEAVLAADSILATARELRGPAQFG